MVFPRKLDNGMLNGSSVCVCLCVCVCVSVSLCVCTHEREQFIHSGIFLCILNKHFLSHQFPQSLSNSACLPFSLLSLFPQWSFCTQPFFSPSLPVYRPFLFMYCAASLCLSMHYLYYMSLELLFSLPFLCLGYIFPVKILSFYW